MAVVLRWRWVLFWWLVGAGLVAFGMVLELWIREETGATGFKRWAAYRFYGGVIEENRWRSRLLVGIGSVLVVLVFLLRTRWDALRHAHFYRRRAGRLDARIRTLVERTTGKRQVPTERLPPRLRRTVERLARQSSAMRIKADRLESEGRPSKGPE